MADEVESAINQLATDCVISSKWHKDDQYKPLDYSRLVSLLAPAVNMLATRVGDLESKVALCATVGWTQCQGSGLLSTDYLQKSKISSLFKLGRIASNINPI